MFNVNDVVSFGTRSARFQNHRGWGSRSYMPRYTGIINAVAPKSITVYAPSWHGPVGEVVFTLRANGRWVEVGKPDDKFDRVSLQPVDIGQVDVSQPHEYQKLLDLGVDKQILDDSIFAYLSQQVDDELDAIRGYEQYIKEEPTEADHWKHCIDLAEHRLEQINDDLYKALKLKNSDLELA
jgi:hypothetical protein